MAETDLFFPLLLGITAFWTYLYPKADNPTGEIICCCALVVGLISFAWFVLSAPWFLNIAILFLLWLADRR